MMVNNCPHEAYQGKCIHCDAKFIDGRAVVTATPEPAHSDLVERLLEPSDPGHFTADDYAIDNFLLREEAAKKIERLSGENRMARGLLELSDTTIRNLQAEVERYRGALRTYEIIINQLDPEEAVDDGLLRERGALYHSLHNTRSYWRRPIMTWSVVFNRYCERGCDKSDAAYRADQWEKRQVQKRWQHCCSTHCERSEECRSPNDCSASLKAIRARAALDQKEQ